MLESTEIIYELRLHGNHFAKTKITVSYLYFLFEDTCDQICMLFKQYSRKLGISFMNIVIFIIEGQR